LLLGTIFRFSGSRPLIIWYWLLRALIGMRRDGCSSSVLLIILWFTRRTRGRGNGSEGPRGVRPPSSVVWNTFYRNQKQQLLLIIIIVHAFGACTTTVHRRRDSCAVITFVAVATERMGNRYDMWTTPMVVTIVLLGREQSNFVATVPREKSENISLWQYVPSVRRSMQVILSRKDAAGSTLKSQNERKVFANDS